MVANLQTQIRLLMAANERLLKENKEQKEAHEAFVCKMQDEVAEQEGRILALIEKLRKGAE